MNTGLPLLDFDGSTYKPDRDSQRLNAQGLRVWKLMSDQGWRTLKEISAATGDPEASVSARLRDFRKSSTSVCTVQIPLSSRKTPQCVQHLTLY